MQLILHVRQSRDGLLGKGQHRHFIRFRHGLLTDMSDAKLLRQNDLALIRFDRLRDQTEHGALATPVGADNAHPLRRVDGERGVHEHVLGTIAFRYIQKFNHMRKTCTLVVIRPADIFFANVF